MNEVGVDGVQHIKDRDFSKVIEAAQHEKGFPRTIDPARYHTVGFNHRVVVPLVDQIIDAVKTGALSRILLIGGCDGSQWDRSYFTELAEATPADSLILTMGCAKNRLIHSPKLHGETLANGLPRVLDMGQCNDSYSAVVVALELANTCAWWSTMQFMFKSMMYYYSANVRRVRYYRLRNTFTLDLTRYLYFVLDFNVVCYYFYCTIIKSSR